jgi:hypothetical protein
MRVSAANRGGAALRRVPDLHWAGGTGSPAESSRSRLCRAERGSTSSGRGRPALNNDIVIVRLPVLILPQPNHQRLANGLGVVSRVKASGSCNEVLRRRWRTADLVRDRLDLGAIWRVESKIVPVQAHTKRHNASVFASACVWLRTWANLSRAYPPLFCALPPPTSAVTV